MVELAVIKMLAIHAIFCNRLPHKAVKSNLIIIAKLNRIGIARVNIFRRIENINQAFLILELHIQVILRERNLLTSHIIIIGAGILIIETFTVDIPLTGNSF